MEEINLTEIERYTKTPIGKLVTLANGASKSKMYGLGVRIFQDENEEDINKLPPTLYELFARGRNLEYELQLDTTKDISKQFKNEETLVIISALNLYFFCGEEEREKLVQIYIENDKKQLNQSYSDKLMKAI